jgi:hypothetical protein
LISDAYFDKGFAWFPINRLQLEQTATLGRAEAAPIVAERASLVFQVRAAAPLLLASVLTPCIRCRR